MNSSMRIPARSVATSVAVDVRAFDPLVLVGLLLSVLVLISTGAAWLT